MESLAARFHLLTGALLYFEAGIDSVNVDENRMHLLNRLLEHGCPLMTSSGD